MNRARSGEKSFMIEAAEKDYHTANIVHLHSTKHKEQTMDSAQMCRNVQNFYFYEYGDINDVGANIQIYLIDAKYSIHC